MKKLLLALLLTLLCPVLAHAQGTQIVSGPTDPPTCDPNKGQLFKNTTSNTIKTCSGVNTWTAIGGSGTSINVNGSSVPNANFKDATNTQYTVAGADVTMSLLGVGLLSGNNTWTGSETHTGTEQFNASTYFKSGVPWFDLAAFGASCNGSSDDTSVIATAYTAASTPGGLLNICDNSVWTTPPTPLAAPTHWVTLRPAGRLTIGGSLQMNTTTCIDGSNAQFSSNPFGSLFPTAVIIPSPSSISPVVDFSHSGLNPGCAKNVSLGNFTGIGFDASQALIQLENVNAVSTSNTAQPYVARGGFGQVTSFSSFGPGAAGTNPSILVEDNATTHDITRWTFFYNDFMDFQGAKVTSSGSFAFGDCSHGPIIRDTIFENSTGSNNADFLTVDSTNNCRRDIGLYNPAVADSMACTFNSGSGSNPIQAVEIILPLGGGCLKGTTAITGLFAHTSQHYSTFVGTTPWSGLIIDGDGIVNLNILSDTGYGDFAEIAAPGNPASGVERWYADSTTHQFSCLRSNGTSCAPAGGGGGGPGTGTTDGFAYWNTATTLGTTTPPTVQGTYNCGYTVPASSAVVPTCPQLGLSGRALAGAATTDTVLYSDNATVVDHDKSASGAINQTLPTATTLNNPNFVYAYSNHSAQTDTITPTTWTIQAGTTAAGATLSVSPGVSCRIKVDPNSATNWIADCSSVGAVTSFSGDGVLLSNVSSTGAVTATVNTAPAHKFWNGAWTQPAFTDISGSVACGQMPALTGDTTSSAGSCATSTSKINGTSFAGTNGDVVLFGAANIPVDSAILGANLVTAAANYTSGDLVQAAANNKTTSDSGIATANVVTAASTLTNNQLVFGAGSKGVAVGDLTGDVTTSGGKTTVLGNIPNTTTMAGDIVATNSAAPASPASGKDSLFTDSTDLRFHDKNASGVIGTTVVAQTCSNLASFTALSTAGAFTCTSITPNIVLDTSTPVTVGSANVATYHNNQNATAGTAVTYNLPTAAAGLQKCFTNSYNGSAADTGVLTIATSASGQFIIFTDGTLSATGGNVTSGGAAADAACVVGIDSTHWQLYVQRGVWSKH
jgi:hypothetical protein